jgi:hypothetical protein
MPFEIRVSSNVRRDNTEGTRLIVTDMDNLVIHVWDLRKLRAELSEALADAKRVMAERNIPKPEAAQLGALWADTVTCWILQAEAEKAVAELIREPVANESSMRRRTLTFP